MKNQKTLIYAIEVFCLIWVFAGTNGSQAFAWGLVFLVLNIMYGAIIKRLDAIAKKGQ